MTTVTLKVLPFDKSIEVAEGTNLLDALIQVAPVLADKQKSDKDGSATARSATFSVTRKSPLR